VPDTKQRAEASLYDADFHAWLLQQADKLRGRAHNEIDWDNLAEEIESVGRSERKEVRSRLALLIHHLLKWQYQPGRRSESWRATIGEQRGWFPINAETSPSLRNYPATVFTDAYADGRRRALRETGLSSQAIPRESPFTVEQALDDSFWPGEPFADWQIRND
jgi:hypothetical protein